MEVYLRFVVCVSLICALLGGCGGGIETRKVQLLEKVEHNFDLPEAHFELGQIYEIQRNWELSIYYYDFACGFDPSQKDAQAKEVKAIADPAAAKSLADKYISQVSGSAVESLRLGMAFHKVMLDQYALPCYQQALSLAPNSSRANRQIGYFYQLKNDDANAKLYLKRSFDINPGQKDVANRLGQLGVYVDLPASVKQNKPQKQKK